MNLNRALRYAMPVHDMSMEELRTAVIELRAELEAPLATGTQPTYTERLEAALQRSLNYLSSYPGGGALDCYNEARAALYDPVKPHAQRKEPK